ncbi:XRE family transcriptional regulator [Litchfieldella rifensis]|uniref:XRE family transcriptional regulator n=1 Tax=Litchfieldella rifensis TaxID=762643 RepID=A0ABV7LIP8_9GAMM
MKKFLNHENASKAMEAAGLTQTAVADALDVSKEAVSQWLNAKSFPRPDKLLKLGKLLELKLDELVIKEEADTPLVAFRKMKGTKTKGCHVEKAQDMGHLLRHLVPYLTFDTIEMPPVLKQPNCEYEYLQRAACKTRKEINLGHNDTVDFLHLIRRFVDLQAVVIPVLWGDKNRHENAVHIYLPDSQTTWIYLNLDVNVHDFKFWMAHELGHCLSPSLSGEEAEDFADAFAGALLFPHEKSEKAYRELKNRTSLKDKVDKLLEFAEDEVISSYTIFKQVNRYANNADVDPIDLGNRFYARITNFNKSYKHVCEALLGDSGNISAREYIDKSEEIFETPFFELLRGYLNDSGKGAGYVQSVLDLPLLDARSLHDELT